MALLWKKKFKIAIIGSGPAGLSAAAHAAELDISHILLESEQSPANTIRKYQKGKHIMAEPDALPLRSPLSFTAGPRENILETWSQELQKYQVNVWVGTQVVAINGESGAFEIVLASGDSLLAEYVVLAIGLQSNIRKLNVPGENNLLVQYQLDDPDEFEGETIVVIGGGDAGIENALALMKRNHVILIDRQEALSSCKETNFRQFKTALNNGELESRLSTSIEAIEVLEECEDALKLVARTPQGVEKICCDRVIARLGADPPRRLVESFGVQFPSNDAASVPQLSSRYESNVPGIFIVGALAGYPLIKQALNQGYEVVEYILGHAVEPADEALLRGKFAKFCDARTVDDGLAIVQRDVPALSGLTTLQLRDFMMQSKILSPEAGDRIFKRNDYSTSFYSILEGEVELYFDSKSKKASFVLKAGDFFGEMGLISGRRRVATAMAGSNCTLIETPKYAMLKLLDSVESVRRKLDEAALRRAVHNCFGTSLSDGDLDYLVRDAKPKRYEAGEILFKEGDKADGLYLIRRGSVTVCRVIHGKDVVLSYVAAGNYVGEMALVSGAPRSATVRAAVASEAMLLEARRVAEVMANNPDMRNQMEKQFLEHVQADVNHQYLEHLPADEVSYASPEPGNLITFLMQQGVGEATDVLLIDYSLCVRCNNCEVACADTHGGTSRLDREAGPTYANVHVPTSCRHCEHPHCMKDCPPDAIHRSVNGEVFIDDSCIGCGNCQRNCPYDVIQMATIDAEHHQRSLWQLLLGVGPEKLRTDRELSKVAVKCDMCKDLEAGPICVRGCPTGAAMRVTPEALLDFAK